MNNLPKIGDQVKAIAYPNCPVMVIESIDALSFATCRWFDDKQQLQKAEFHLSRLEVTSNNPNNATAITNINAIDNTGSLNIVTTAVNKEK